jgi:hypothetical protein
MNSIASKSPIVSWMVMQVISSGEIENTPAKHRIDNDVVPVISQKTHMMSSGFQESVLKVIQPVRIEPQIQPKFSKQVAPPVQNIHVILDGYGRLSNLIKDNSISTIEYSGENLPLKITRLGRTQLTNIILSNDEVNSILNYISSRTRIPIENQVFKVSLDNFLFNAVISKEIGTRFLIKKNFQISQDYSEAFR